MQTKVRGSVEIDLLVNENKNWVEVEKTLFIDTHCRNDPIVHLSLNNIFLQNDSFLSYQNNQSYQT